MNTIEQVIVEAVSAGKEVRLGDAGEHGMIWLSGYTDDVEALTGIARLYDCLAVSIKGETTIWATA